MTEQWAWIPGYENIYEVSNLGRVRRGDHQLKINQSGSYYFVYLTKDGKSHQGNLRNILDVCFDEHVFHESLLDEFEEVWRPVPDFEGYYEVSSKGRVRTCQHIRKSRGNSTAVVRPRIKQLCDDSDGYLTVSLYAGKRSANKRVHRLVAEAFIANPSNLPQVNHIDSNKHNNSVENLEWCTNLYNIQHSVNFGDRDYTKISAASVEVWGIKLICNETGQQFQSIKELSRALNIKYDVCYNALHKYKYFKFGDYTYSILN